MMMIRDVGNVAEWLFEVLLTLLDGTGSGMRLSCLHNQRCRRDRQPKHPTVANSGEQPPEKLYCCSSLLSCSVSGR